MVRGSGRSWRITLKDKLTASEVTKILQQRDWEQQLEGILSEGRRKEGRGRAADEEGRKKISGEISKEERKDLPGGGKREFLVRRKGKPWLTSNVVSAVLWSNAKRNTGVDAETLLGFYRWAEKKASIGGSWQALHCLFPVLFKAGLSVEVGRVARPLFNSGLRPNLAICSIMIRGSVASRDLENARVMIESVVSRGRTTLPASDFKFIIKAFCKLEKMESVLRYFAWMVDAHGPDEVTLRVVMVALCERKMVEEAFEIYETVADRGYPVGDTIVGILVGGILSSRPLTEVYALFDMLSTGGDIALDASTLRTIRDRVLLQERKVHAAERELGFSDTELWRSLERLKARGFEPTLPVVFQNVCHRIQAWHANELLRLLLEKGMVFESQVYEIVIESLCKAGYPDDGLVLLKEMALRRVIPGAATFNTVADGFAKAGRLEQVKEVYQGMMEAGYTLRASGYGILISCLCKVGNFDEAYKLLDTMRLKRFKRKAIAYSTIINWLCKLNRVEEARELIEKMARYAPPDALTYGPIVERLCKTKRIDDALATVEEMATRGIKPDAFIYNFVLSGLCQEEKVEEARLLFEKMVKQRINPNVVTYNTLINGLCKAWRIETAYELFKEMAGKGYVPTEVSYNTLIDGFCKKKDLVAAKDVFDKMVRSNCVPNVVTYTTLIDGLSKSGKVQAAAEVLDGMVKKGVTPNVATYSCLIDGFCKVRRVDEAHKLLEQMVTQGIAPTVVTYNILLNSLCRADKLEDAFKLFRGMAQRRCHPTVVTYNTLLRALCHHKQLDGAHRLYAEMIAKGCPPDAITYDTLAWGLTRAGKVHEAQELMEKMKLTKRNPFGRSSQGKA
ncbi:pentatricopeptide repeat-containing protein At1g64580 [Selaginella moellendorffii]|nr:pentatricopeptide repeat-containing protein At1g64580 [Selaginella moellendorffii]|eukprot:XP_024524718.1 pentatricopeptide repeat-containing protein At1g64580 [Selaginella moellendorffii]